MADKKVVIVEPEDIKSIVISDAAMYAYKFALDKAGMEMTEEEEADFISVRNGLRGWGDLWKFRTMLKKLYESIEVVCKHAFNIGSPDDIPEPKEVGWKAQWNAQTYDYKIDEGCGSKIVQILVEKGEIDLDKLYDSLNFAQIANACGMTNDGLLQRFPNATYKKEKARVFSIKEA